MNRAFGLEQNGLEIVQAVSQTSFVRRRRNLYGFFSYYSIFQRTFLYSFSFFLLLDGPEKRNVLSKIVCSSHANPVIHELVLVLVAVKT